MLCRVQAPRAFGLGRWALLCACVVDSGADGPILTGLQYPYMCAVDNMFAKYGGPTLVRGCALSPMCVGSEGVRATHDAVAGECAHPFATTPRTHTHLGMLRCPQIAFSEPNVPGSVYSVHNDGTNVQLVGTDMNAPMGVKLGYRHFFA